MKPPGEGDRGPARSAPTEELVLELERLRAENRALSAELVELRGTLAGEGAPEGLRALRESEARNRSIISSMAEGVVVQTAEGVIRTANAAAERILGLTVDQMSGRTSLDLRWRAIHEDGSEFPGESHPAMVTLRTGTACRDVVMGVHKPGGELTWISINTEPVFGRDATKPEAVVCSFADITAYRGALLALRQSDERLKLALSAARMGTWQWEIARDEVLWSENVEEIMGILPGTFSGTFHDYLRLIVPEDKGPVRAAIEEALGDEKKGDAFRIEHRVVQAGGGPRWVECKGRVFRDAEGKPVRMAGTVVDASERKQLEARLLHSQKMETVGRLAGGVAHDFNNVLTAILNATYLAALDNRDARVNEHLQLIRNAGERAGKITRQLLTFARRQVIATKSIDVGALLGDVTGLLRRLVGEHIDIVLDIAPDLSRVRADEGQLEQVLVNLAVNARDAMPSGGTLRISTRNLERSIGDPEALVDSIEITVTDTGTGMAEHTLAHAFEPFFTTKEDGSGLGLSTCYGIIQGLGGTISLFSQPFGGTRVTVRLPRELEVSETKRSAPPDAEPFRGAETILLVEDDPLVRRLVFRVLRDAGYNVLRASGGGDALSLSRSHPGLIHLLLTDVVMPEMSGGELARLLAAERPDTKVLFMSGYTGGALSQHGFDESKHPLLPKPYTPGVLTRKVRSVLDS